MKYVKILGLLAVAAGALMAFAGSASATTVTSPTGGNTTPEIHAVSKGEVTLDSPISPIKCESTVTGTVTAHGSGVTTSGPITQLNWIGCTEWHVTTVANGTLEVHWTSGYNGTLTSTGSKVSATIGGITCVYGTNNTSIGTVTGGSPATLDIEAKIPVVASESSVFCGTGATTWTGNYETTAALYVDP